MHPGPARAQTRELPSQRKTHAHSFSSGRRESISRRTSCSSVQFSSVPPERRHMHSYHTGFGRQSSVTDICHTIRYHTARHLHTTSVQCRQSAVLPGLFLPVPRHRLGAALGIRQHHNVGDLDLERPVGYKVGERTTPLREIFFWRGWVARWGHGMLGAAVC